MRLWMAAYYFQSVVLGLNDDIKNMTMSTCIRIAQQADKFDAAVAILKRP